MADLGGNSFPEVVMGWYLGRPAQIWVNPCHPMFAGEPIALETDSGSKVALGDLDRDGDIVTVVARPRGNLVYWNEGAGRFTEDGTQSGNGPSEAVALADFDLDGNPDVFVASFGASAEVWLAEFPVPSAKVLEHDVRAWAGTGEFGSTCDGGPALAVRFENPRDLAVDSAGVVYEMEGKPGRVRRIGVDRIVSRVLSGSEGAATGDGGPLSQATFGRIASVAVDGQPVTGQQSGTARGSCSASCP